MKPRIEIPAPILDRAYHVLHGLAAAMDAEAHHLAHLGRFQPEWIERARELDGAAKSVRGWANAIRANESPQNHN